MKTLTKAVSMLLVMPLLMFAQMASATPANPDDSKNTVVVEMEGTNQLKFTVTEINAAPGQRVTVKLTTVSNFPKMAMAHNFVLLTANADATAVARASAKASDNDYIASEMKDQIIAYTDLAGGGETVEISFTAPEEPGTYEYICTFPGHYSAGMKGVLTVKQIET